MIKLWWVLMLARSYYRFSRFYFPPLSIVELRNKQSNRNEHNVRFALDGAQRVTFHRRTAETLVSAGWWNVCCKSGKCSWQIVPRFSALSPSFNRNTASQWRIACQSDIWFTGKSVVVGLFGRQWLPPNLCSEGLDEWRRRFWGRWERYCFLRCCFWNVFESSQVLGCHFLVVFLVGFCLFVSFFLRLYDECPYRGNMKHVRISAHSEFISVFLYSDWPCKMQCNRDHNGVVKKGKVARKTWVVQELLKWICGTWQMKWKRKVSLRVSAEL